jgi:hypothetical protein
MKKKLSSLSTALLLVLLSFTGCQKEIQEQPITNPETESLARGDNGGDKNECRMINLGYDGGGYNYHYNRQGLADKWDITDYGLFKQEYNSKGRLTKSRLYVEGSLINTIQFFYDKDKPVKEIWYEGNTSVVYDEVFYTYNRKGQMVRMESFMGDYYTISAYTPEGNVLSWEFFLGGLPYMSGYYKFIQHYKNPYLSVNGIEHGFPFFNSSVISNKWWPSSEKIVVYDENGDPVVLYDFDPLQTIWQRGHQGYPRSATYFDLISGTWFPPYTFEYENCGGRNDDNDSQIAQPSSTASGKINPMMLLKHHPSKSIKEQMREIRNQLKNK